MKANFKYIDIHTHLNLAVFNDDYREAAERAREAGVAMINIGTQKDTSFRAVELAEELGEGFYATVGIHPVHTHKSYHDEAELGPEGKAFTSRGEEFSEAEYRKLAEHEKVVAIGECGLDYYRPDNAEAISKQEKVLIEHIELANSVGKPLMLHIRASDKSMDAYEDALVLLKKYAKVKGNVHFFAGTLDIAKQFWEMGFTTSLTGVITFTHDYDEVVKNAPREMIHAETDAPYVAPKPFRGSRNEPIHVREVYKKIAELRGEDEDVVRLQLLENAKRLFRV